jgi:predicted Zn-dependent protease
MTRCTLALVLAFAIVLAWIPTSAAQSGDPAARAQAADAAIKAGRFEDAAAIYRGLLETTPATAGLLTNLGYALVMAGHAADAVAPLERAVTLDPGLVTAQIFLGAAYVAVAQPAKAIAPLERAAAARPVDVDIRRRLADAYAASGRSIDAAIALRKATELAPRIASSWYALGEAYNDVKQDAMRTFGERPDDAAWQQLLVADGLLGNRHFTDAFVLYRAAAAQLPGMVSIHDSVALIYERTGHAAWAVRERAAGRLTASQCARRKALCEFRAGRYRAALTAALAGTDPESRYWRARAAAELSRAAFTHLDTLPDSAERRSVRAAVARAEERYTDAIAELRSALALAPRNETLLYELASACFSAQDFEQALATLSPLVDAHPDDGRLLELKGAALLRLRRLDEALPVLQRAVERDPSNADSRLTLGRAYVQHGDFAAAIPLVEPRLDDDQDGSLHVQLARAYTGIGDPGKAAALLERSQSLQRESEARRAAAAQRSITAPK